MRSFPALLRAYLQSSLSHCCHRIAAAHDCDGSLHQLSRSKAACPYQQPAQLAWPATAMHACWVESMRSHI